MYFILSFEKGESQRFVTYEMKLQTIHYIKWYAMKYNSIQFSTMDPSLMYSKLWMASLRSPVVTWNAKIIWSFDKADTTWNPSVWLRELSKFLILTGHICDLTSGGFMMRTLILIWLQIWEYTMRGMFCLSKWDLL